MTAERKCRTCRYWNAHSTDLNLGDCMAPGDHRYSHVRMPDGRVAYLDSFGREETKPNYTCGAHRFGSEETLQAEASR